MTATPKVYSDDTKVQAQENDVLLCSMDDEDIYGQEFHRLNFGEAVNGLWKGTKSPKIKIVA
jgi:predicted helicase